MPPTDISFCVPLANASISELISLTTGMTALLLLGSIKPVTFDKIRRRSAPIALATRADKVSLSPNLISSVEVVSFSLIIGTQLKFNNIKIKQGMILSNEPGYYKKNNYGIRIENLVYVNKKNKSLFFENLTMVPIEKDLINYDLLTASEKNYLFRYHLDVYSKLSKYLSPNERKWLATYI